MKLYSYFRSSAAYRVRIALNLKGLAYEYAPIHLLRDGGQQLKPDYRELNPDGIVPTFIDGDNVLTQSLAIIEYLDEMHPEPALLPGTPLDRAFVRSVALQIACEIHPVDNLRILKYLKHTKRKTRGTGIGWIRASSRWKSGWRMTRAWASCVSEIPPRLRICASCRRCTTRGVLISI
jgi:maleylpyruvate isomerase